MQLIGLAILAFVVWYGFAERNHAQISAFDFHAAVMVLGGSTAAIMVSSTAINSVRTLTALREILPGAGVLGRATAAMEEERRQLVDLWREGKRAQAVQLAEQSDYPPIARMIPLIIDRAPDEATQAAYTEEKHRLMIRWQPAVGNWEMLAKLAPSFGMVGTITGMIQLFKNMDGDDMNIGSAMSLALLATLYGVAFGAGVAGPIGHFLRGLLDERLGVIERCEDSVKELVARGSGA